MPEFTPDAQAAIDDVARTSGFSAGAVAVMLAALERGHWRMAQFDHPEFGGAGQWMRGGMTMIGDMFNAALTARIQGLCAELCARIGESGRVFERNDPTGASVRTGPAGGAGAWWPSEWGEPGGSGAQGGMRYAYFPAKRRLAIESAGRVTIYDTRDHRIGGVAQQQSVDGTLTFTSQHGTVDLGSLAVVPGGEPSAAAGTRAAAATADDVFATLERLADLARKGVLSPAEFAAKKAELLQRL